MTRFAKLMELVRLARALEADAARMTRGTRGRIDRECEAVEYRAKSEWLAGRLSDDEYGERLREIHDARSHADALAAEQRAREAAPAGEPLPLAAGDEIPF